MKKILLLLPVAALALTACSADPAPGSSDPAASAGASGSANAPTKNFGDDSTAARTIALQHFAKSGNVAPIIIKQDLSDDSATWEFEALLGDTVHKASVPSEATAATDQGTEKADAEDLAAGKAQMTMDVAIRTAVSNTPGQVRDVEFDNGHWEVEILTESSGTVTVEIDAATGQLLVDR